MTIIESIKTYFENCDLINKTINVDYLPEEPLEYTIVPVPTKPIIQKYLDGSAKKQYNFLLCSREYFGDDIVQLSRNLAFYENLAKWIEENSYSGNLPTLPENCEALRLTVTNSGYLFNEENDNAQYQIECNLVYFEMKG